MTGQRVTEMSLDGLTSVFIHIIIASLSSQETKADLNLTWTRWNRNTDKAQAAVLLAIYDYLIHVTASNGTPVGGLTPTGAFIVLPFTLPRQICPYV